MAQWFSLWDDDIREIEIVSDALSMMMPEPKDEIEQRLTLKRDGTVQLRRYIFGDGINQYIESENRVFTVSKQKIRDLFDYIGFYLQFDSGQLLVTDVGYWNLTLTNKRGHRTPVSGPLFHNERIICYNEESVCDIIRDLLGISDLLLFDGNMDRLDFIDIEYSRKHIESGNYYKKERLKIDRGAKQIIYTTLDNEGRRYQQILEGDKQIFTLLNELGDECFLDRQEAVTVVPDDKQAMSTSYRIETRTKQGKTYMCEDSFDCYHVPEDWTAFVELFKKYFVNHLRCGEMLAEKYYNREVRLVSDLCFVIVQFSEYGRDYAYLCDDDTVKAGDWVLVPVGEYNTTEKVRVERVEFHQPDKAPYPMHKIKKVIRKFNPATDVDPSLEASLESSDMYR